jgi:hypothetical protein
MRQAKAAGANVQAWRVDSGEGLPAPERPEASSTPLDLRRCRQRARSRVETIGLWTILQKAAPRENMESSASATLKKIWFAHTGREAGEIGMSNYRHDSSVTSRSSSTASSPIRQKA